MAAGSTGSTFPKWQLAILLGAPVALGLGYLYWKNQNPSIKENEKKKLLDATKNNKSAISIDGDDKSDKNSVAPPKKDLTPLDQAQAYKNTGNTHFKNGKYDDAIEYYCKAIETCPIENIIDLSTFYQNRAAAYELLQKWNSVKDDCSKALDLNPRYVKALHRRARAFEHLKELENCLEDVTATCILEGFQNKNALLLADRILKELGRIHARGAMTNRKHNLQSQHFIKNYFASFSEDPVQKLVVVASSGKEQGFLKAKKALDESKFDIIIAACTEEIESSESESDYKLEATLLRGTFYLMCGNYEAALVDLDSIINNKDVGAKFRANALIKRASLNMQMEKHEECFRDFNEAEKVDPQNPDVFHHRGQVYVLIEMLMEALNDFENSLKYAPNQPITYVHKCYAEYRIAVQTQNNMLLMNVMNNFASAIEKYPDCVECYSLLAQVLSEQQHFEPADSYFDKAIVIDPSNAALYVHRGLLQLQWTGDVDRAVELIKTAIDIDEKCEFAYETLGTIEVQRANLERAIELFDKALELAKSEMEMVHIFSLKDAAIAQITVSKKLGIDMSRLAAIASGGI